MSDLALYARTPRPSYAPTSDYDAAMDAHEAVAAVFQTLLQNGICAATRRIAYQQLLLIETPVLGWHFTEDHNPSELIDDLMHDDDIAISAPSFARFDVARLDRELQYAEEDLRIDAAENAGCDAYDAWRDREIGW